jgi:hypothetical protein
MEEDEYHYTKKYEPMETTVKTTHINPEHNVIEKITYGCCSCLITFDMNSNNIKIYPAIKYTSGIGLEGEKFYRCVRCHNNYDK